MFEYFLLHRLYVSQDELNTEISIISLLLSSNIKESQ